MSNLRDESPSAMNTDSIKARRSKNKKKKNKNVTSPVEPLTSEEATVLDEDEEMKEEDIGPVKAYIPGRSRPLMDDEQLIMDKSAYRMFHEFQTESASLSFDILLDNLGYDRDAEINGSPHSLTLVSGSQAAKGINNNLIVLRLANLLPYRRKVKKSNADAESNSDSSDEDSDSSSDEENLDAQPELEAAVISHKGVVNRIRTQQFGGRYLAASWSEAKEVFLWDLTRPLTAVNDSSTMGEYTRGNESPAPIFTFKGHKSEGFAIDWHPYPSSAGHLLSGDCNGAIFHWIPRSSGWSVGPSPYGGHSDSVEDIQWSPTEPTVFISVSADKSFRVWDVRSPPASGSMITVADAHPADVNVATWNRLQPSCFLTGGDDGSLRVWDLRVVHKRYGSTSASSSCQIPAYTHLYNYHQKPITSVEWHPTDAGVFVATSEDDQITVWDTTLEQADKEDQLEQEKAANGDGCCSGDTDDVDSLPIQLLFIHSGQTEVKEAHWHPQIPGLLCSTSLSGFNVFRTCNV